MVIVNQKARYRKIDRFLNIRKLHHKKDYVSVCVGIKLCHTAFLSLDSLLLIVYEGNSQESEMST